MEDAGEEKRCLKAAARQLQRCRQMRGSGGGTTAVMAQQRRARERSGWRMATRGERRGATARWRVAGPIDPRRDNNGGQGVVTSTKLDDAMDHMDFGVETFIEGHGEVYVNSYLDAVDISQLSVRWGHLSGSVDIS
ncbi:hypothetical protein Scep_013957 [Stephania cephalantha]|uniref:Uncharacterized protein n=1 Tax=Stephania cephalantha TaxID=152367 RepID=A0AAP0P2I8_9MAGN